MIVANVTLYEQCIYLLSLTDGYYFAVTVCDLQIMFNHFTAICCVYS